MVRTASRTREEIRHCGSASGEMPVLSALSHYTVYVLFRGIPVLSELRKEDKGGTE
jgi:hypothetical protein